MEEVAEERVRQWEAAACRMEAIVKALGGWTAELVPEARAQATLAETLIRGGPTLSARDTDSIELGISELFLAKERLDFALLEAKARNGRYQHLAENTSQLSESPRHEQTWSTEEEQIAQAQKAAYLRKKAQKYTHEADSILRRKGRKALDLEVDQDTALRLAKEAKAVREKLHDKLRLLGAYEGLPADIDLARLKVEETRKRVAALEAEVSSPLPES